MQFPSPIAGAGEEHAQQAGLSSHSTGSTHILHINEVDRSLNLAQQRREAVLLTFCDPLPAAYAKLQHLSVKQWQPLLHWLDTSGLALYFLDRMTELELCEMFPPAVLSRLQQNLADNTAKTAAMIAESTVIHHSFQRIWLSYATLKGFSLWPVSVPKLELRSQLDMDFLVAESSAAEAKNILERRGYRLHAISGRTWEFKTNQEGPHSLKYLYKAMPQRSVELHLEATSTGRSFRLGRTEKRYFHGACMPVLSPVDLFLSQGLHLYKHLCGAHSRTAHLIEFRRHILVRHHDDAFWKNVRQLAERDPKIPIALGLVTALISHVMGDFAPEALTCWTVDCLPAAARLWVELYGRRTVFCNTPGTKLYLLLQKALDPAGVQSGRSLRHALLPCRLPPIIVDATPGEVLSTRILRCRRQLHFILFRLRFHIVEGLRYLYESARWRQHIGRLSR